MTEELKRSDALSSTTFKTRLIQLFQATIILCKSVSVSARLHNHVSVGRQYDFNKFTAANSLEHFPRTDILLN